MTETPKYPQVKVQLTGENGNALLIIRKTRKAMKMAGVPREELDEYVRQATGGDYENVLAVTMEYVDVE